MLSILHGRGNWAPSCGFEGDRMGDWATSCGFEGDRMGNWATGNAVDLTWAQIRYGFSEELQLWATGAATRNDRSPKLDGRTLMQ